MKETYLHRLSVEAKLFAFLCVIIAVFLFNHPLANLAVLAVLLAVVLLLGLTVSAFVFVKSAPMEERNFVLMCLHLRWNVV